jgi:hemoglobin-like flavoprotein
MKFIIKTFGKSGVKVLKIFYEFLLIPAPELIKVYINSNQKI